MKFLISHNLNVQNHFNVLDYISGNTDTVIPVTSTRYSINALKLPTVSPWRAWYDDGEVSHSTMTDFFVLNFL